MKSNNKNMLTINNFNIPILFMVFNRLDTTKQVFEMIRKVAPQKLYIASDGHRINRENEKEKVEAVREYILKSIDWNCEVKTLFREQNLGCGVAPAQAITWLFENEEMGIILEDDCLPSLSFFSYCKKLLEYYKDDTRIYHIAGNNPLVYTKIPYSYYFARIQHCWGWASWRRTWSHYSFDIKNLNDFIEKKTINKIFTRNIDRNYWINIFKSIEKPKNDIWDYQWTYAILKNNGICINPSKNLITNIGFGTDATHTTNYNSYQNNQQRFEIDYLKHPKKIKINNNYIKKINQYVFGIKTPCLYIRISEKLLKLIRKNIFIYTLLKNARNNLRSIYKSNNN
jgi:hypothetical protein